MPMMVVLALRCLPACLHASLHFPPTVHHSHPLLRYCHHPCLITTPLASLPLVPCCCLITSLALLLHDWLQVQTEAFVKTKQLYSCLTYKALKGE